MKLKTETKVVEALEPAYRPSAFARAVDLSVNTIYRKIAAGEIKSIRIGSRTIRIPRSEVLRLRGEPVE